MTTLMVHLELGGANTKLLQATADLANRLNADVMGIAVCRPLQIAYGDGFVATDLIEQDRELLEKEMRDAEAEFRASLRKHNLGLEWRSMITLASLSDYLADQSRCADLMVTGAGHDDSMLDSSRHVDLGHLVMKLGRPVLIVPATAEKVGFKRMLIGWRDTRECRRAVLDALPLLRKAEQVAVCEIVAEEDMPEAHARLADVVNWLKRDGITAQPIASVSTGDDAARLDGIAGDQAADMIVAGAYGHSRLHEWALGGVTRDLLLRAARCSFVSH